MRPRLPPFAVLWCGLVPACAPRGSLLPDYAELLAAGVEPVREAEVVERTLEEAGFVVDERAEGEGFVALGLVRAADAHRAVRVVTSRGVAFALDSAPDAVDLSAPHGEVHVDVASTGHDVDGDDRRDVVVSRHEAHRTCLLVLALAVDGGLEALRVDATGLEPDACLEAFDDIDGRVGAEALVRLRAPALARTRMPTTDVPLERDEAGVYGLRPPPVAYLGRVRAALAAAAVDARARLDEEQAYTLAVEAALVARAAGESRERALEAFDEVAASVVWSEPLADAVRAARAHIARDWR